VSTHDDAIDDLWDECQRLIDEAVREIQDKRYEELARERKRNGPTKVPNSLEEWCKS
jgi:hypothetical protein